MYTSSLLMVISFPVWQNIILAHQALAIGFVFLIPGGIDGLTQMFGNRKSNNKLRAITGFGLGMGIMLFMYGFIFLIFELFQ